MSLEIKCIQCPIEKVFGDDFAFSLPFFQRPYTWTTEVAGVLLDDLIAAQQFDSADPYFLGSIVIIKGVAPKAEIIDGQQRLTTLTILLCVLRALTNDAGADLARYIYGGGNQITGMRDHFRLHIRESDFFQRYIQREGGIQRLDERNPAELTDSERHLYDTAMVFQARLREMDVAALLELARYILQRCILIVVSTDELDSAYHIFSVLNRPGLDLTAADILKGEILSRIKDEERRRAYTAKWEDIEDDVGRGNFETLLKYMRVMYEGGDQEKLFLQEFRRLVIKRYPTAEDLMDESIIPCSRAYAVIMRAAYAHDNDDAALRVNAASSWLNMLGVNDWYPVALRMFVGNENKPDLINRCLLDLERIVASLLLAGVELTKRRARYATIIKLINSNPTSADLAYLFAPTSPLQLSDKERSDTIRHLNGDIYKRASTFRLYLLLRLDSTLSEGNTHYTTKDCTIEHVLPSGPAPGSEWKTLFTDDEQKFWVNRLANLVLLTKRINNDAANYSFLKKKSIYFSSKERTTTFALTTQVMSLQRWDTAVLQQRQMALLQKLKTLWRL